MIKQENGFTLVELIVTIVLVGIVGTFTTLFLYTGFNGYLRAKDTAEGALNAQIALDRISLELRDIVEIGAFTNNVQIDYTYMTPDDNRKDRKIIYSNGAISLDVEGSTNELLDGVSNFTMTLTPADLNNSGDGSNEVQAINVGFTVGEIRREFKTQIFPRNMVPEPPPP
jgi:prepilin-type N-terminal cleavage/methylation domain-containing protein